MDRRTSGNYPVSTEGHFIMGGLSLSNQLLEFGNPNAQKTPAIIHLSMMPLLKRKHNFDKTIHL